MFFYFGTDFKSAPSFIVIHLSDVGGNTNNTIANNSPLINNTTIDENGNNDEIGITPPDPSGPGFDIFGYHFEWRKHRNTTAKKFPLYIEKIYKHKKVFKHGISFGLRINNLVILDVNIGLDKVGKLEQGRDFFPGRQKGDGSFKASKFSLFYRVKDGTTTHLNRVHFFQAYGKWTVLNNCEGWHKNLPFDGSINGYDP